MRRRRVLYVHGFDPRGPSPYHQMFEREAALQAGVDGAQNTVGPRKAASKTTAEWDVVSIYGGVETQTRYSFLRWDDVARSLWTRGDVNLWRELWAWVGDYRTRGAFAYARAGAKPGYWAMLTPPLGLLNLLFDTALAAALLAWLGWRIAGAPPGALAGLVPVLLLPVTWRWVDATWNLAWLSRCFAFIGLGARGGSAALLEREAEFAADIVAACADASIDEVLIVGHSQGAPVAVQALSRALALRPDLGAAGPTLSLLTLGQPISIWSFLAPAKGGFRQDVAAVRDARDIFWLDVTSPSDSVSACGLSPLDVVGAVDETRPARRSPHFHLSLSPKTFWRIRLRPFAFHFQYLCATEVADTYSYFRMICGPARLCDFADGWTQATVD